MTAEAAQIRRAGLTAKLQAVSDARVINQAVKALRARCPPWQVAATLCTEQAVRYDAPNPFYVPPGISPAWPVKVRLAGLAAMYEAIQDQHDNPRNHRAPRGRR